ncbi:hypothetical protein WJX73_001982 [Symbiochloris irregularis]|uniref:Uncharacterized protein n=1 Tax=Symbiochloris irregularis TaxID=706552 RepID=A0AAW1NKG1_9CHLO
MHRYLHSRALIQAPSQQTVISPQAVGGAQGSHALVPVADNQAMVHLLGLRGVPSAEQGYVYTHPESGYVFELRDASPHSCDSSDDEAPGDVIAPEPEELEYRPLHLGSVSQVLPYYLCDLVRFDKHQRQKVVGRILDALGKWRASSA